MTGWQRWGCCVGLLLLGALLAPSVDEAGSTVRVERAAQELFGP